MDERICGIEKNAMVIAFFCVCRFVCLVYGFYILFKSIQITVVYYCKDSLFI